MKSGDAPPGIVPRVFAEDGDGYGLAAKCCLCGRRIVQADLCYGHLRSDPPGVTRPLHVKCQREFELFVLALALWPY